MKASDTDCMCLSRVNSIRVESGAWICYDHPDFKGQQYILEHGEYPEFQRWNSHNDHMGSCKPIRMVNTSRPTGEGCSGRGLEAHVNSSDSDFSQEALLLFHTDAPVQD